MVNIIREGDTLRLELRDYDVFKQARWLLRCYENPFDPPENQKHYYFAALDQAPHIARSLLETQAKLDEAISLLHECRIGTVDDEGLERDIQSFLAKIGGARQ